MAEYKIVYGRNTRLDQLNANMETVGEEREASDIATCEPIIVVDAVSCLPNAPGDEEPRRRNGWRQRWLRHPSSGQIPKYIILRYQRRNSRKKNLNRKDQQDLQFEKEQEHEPDDNRHYGT